jgi:hypothetical protein
MHPLLSARSGGIPGSQQGSGIPHHQRAGGWWVVVFHRFFSFDFSRFSSLVLVLSCEASREGIIDYK